MKILLCSLITLISLPVFAQLNCNNVNAVISHSVSGGTVTLTNSSVPVNPTNCITTYEIDWGDNQGLTYVYNSNAAQLRTYHTSGTYTIQLKMHVTDTLNNIYCKDSATTTATVTTSLNCNNVNAADICDADGSNII